MRALITGAAGFVAGHLASELVSGGWEVHGAGISHEEGRPFSPAPTQVPRANGHSSAFVSFTNADVNDAAAMRQILEASAPDAIFHLAGISSVGAAKRDPALAFQANCIGTIVLLRELVGFRDRRRGAAGAGESWDPVCLVVGSAEQYGAQDPSRMPLGENECLRPVSIYASSKCAQESAALQVSRELGIRVVCVRSFNHSGSGQRPGFLLPDLVSRALQLKGSGGRSLAIGNATPVRDFLHVVDVVRAYRLLVERGESGQVYNVCSGTGKSVKELATAVLEHVGVEASIDESSEHKRAVDVPILIGDNRKLSAATGWKAVRDIDAIIEDLIDAASK